MSQPINSSMTQQPGTARAGATHSDSARRLQILAALDIDVWQVRGVPAESRSGVQVETPASTGAGIGRRSGSAAAAALALLEGAERRSIEPASVPDQSSSQSQSQSQSQNQAQSNQAPVSLWCLSGPHGVMLANLTGLSPQGMRLLSDIFQAAMRIVASERSTKKLSQQKLHFNWPPADGRAELGSDARTSRALRGFLSRQLQEKPDAVLLYAASDLRALLAEAAPDIAAERLLYIGEPEVLLKDSAAKRALWQTLNTL